MSTRTRFERQMAVLLDQDTYDWVFAQSMLLGVSKGSVLRGLIFAGLAEYEGRERSFKPIDGYGRRPFPVAQAGEATNHQPPIGDNQ